MMDNPSLWAATVNERSYPQLIKLIFCLGLFLYAATAVINIGIIAVDDYEFGVARAIPAQTTDFNRIIAERDIRSAIPSLALAATAKFALRLVLHDPTNQLRFILLMIAIFAFCVNGVWGRFHFQDYPKQTLFLFLISFYFLCPLFLSRLMIESL